MIRSQFHRRPNRLHLLPIVLDMLHNRTWFSARQVAHAVYYGRGVPHSQQLAYVRHLLDGYVRAGYLVHEDSRAACTLYGFAQGRLLRPRGKLLAYFLRCWPPGWPEENITALQAAKEDLDRFIPLRPDTRLYLPNGRLQVPPPRAKELSGPYPLESRPEHGCVWLPRKRYWRARLMKWTCSA